MDNTYQIRDLSADVRHAIRVQAVSRQIKIAEYIERLVALHQDLLTFTKDALGLDLEVYGLEPLDGDR